MWKEIYYDKLPHVFQTPFQFGPLDFYEQDFYKHRKNMIDAQLQRIREMTRNQVKDYFLKMYDEHKNYHNMLVNWDN